MPQPRDIEIESTPPITHRTLSDQVILDNGDQTDHKLEAQLIVECSRTQIPSDRIDNVSRALRRSLDWDYVFEVCRRNAVFPLVGWNLLKHFGDLLPGDIKQELDARFHTHTQNNMFLTGKMLSVVKLFDLNNIPVLPFKGPLLAQQAYGNLALRKYGDLDILVRRADLEKAVSVLTSFGYTPLNELYSFDNIQFYLKHSRHAKDIMFVDRDESTYIELHWRLSNAYFDVPIKTEHLWGQSETQTLGGVAVSTLSFNHLLIYLCLHGSKHFWERLAWICDVNELVRSAPNTDWDQLMSEAKKMGCEKVVRLAFRLVYEFFGHKVRIRNWEKVVDDKTFDEIVAHTRRRLFSLENTPIKIGDRYLYCLKLKERASDRWKLHRHYISSYSRKILTPNEADETEFHLPRALKPLYYVMRPLRLFYTFVIKMKKETVTKTR